MNQRVRKEKQMILTNKLTEARVLEFALDFLEKNIEYEETYQALFEISEDDLEEQDPEELEDESALTETALNRIEDLRGGILLSLQVMEEASRR